ncbi:methyltransferase [Dactylosporangium sp. CA-092794]|uniref:methyltransferase n=1 Tax=Dactylosporangium sp. CA-092794 TaxID=3239929 RepID=UPI003D940F90
MADVEQRPNARAAMRLHELANSLGVAAAVQAAAQLGIADSLGEQPVPVADLARAVGADEGVLHRLMRALAHHGVFRDAGQHRYAHTELSRLLRTDAPGSRRDMVLLAGMPWAWEVWPRLGDAVRTGKAVFPAIYGKDQFRYLSEDAPDAAAVFNRAMTNGSVITGRAVADTLDVADVRTVADIGGGHGLVLRHLLERHQRLSGVLMDLPSVVAGAEAALRPGGGLAGRCRIVGGDCRAEVPFVADLYLLKHVLHMWDDDQAAAALSAIARSAPSGARVVVVEQLVDASPEPGIAAVIDLLMLLNMGGKERTRDDFAALFERCGLRPAGVTATPSMVHLIEAVVR